jgi:3-phytase
VITVNAQADARVEQASPNSNFGTSSTLDADGSPAEESYARFAVSGVTGTVTKAVLRFHVTNASVDGPAVYLAANEWTERAITWNNRPARTGAVVADRGAISAGVFADYDVTAAVRGNGTYTFNLASSSTDGSTFRSREDSSSTRRPQLVLTTGTSSGDTTPPNTSITAGPSGTVTAREASVSFSSSEANSTFQCRLDGAAYATCSSPTTVTGLADGNHTFDVRAIDASGNVDTTPASRTWTVSGGTAGGVGALGSVSATVETQPVPHSGDAADDPAIWVNAQDPSSSTVIATDKLGALLVYDLAGRQLQSLPLGKANNVDLRSNLVTFSNRSNNSIGIYEVDPATRLLRDVAARVVTTGVTIYGECMYRSAATGKSYVFVTSTTGQIQQWELVATSTGKIDATMVRSFAVGSKAEGCVADDQLGNLFVGEETRGIWKFGAEPDAATTGTLIAPTTTTGPLVNSGSNALEGLTLTYGPDGTGYLIASSQGNNTYAAFTRAGSHDFVRSFKIVASGGIDGTSVTDGIDVSTAGLGPAFPTGVFVAQDGANDGANQNFKLVPYQQVAALLP